MMDLSNFSHADGVPLYVRIRESIRSMIISGELERGQKLPAEGVLAEQYGVSRMTVRQGISDLINDGLLYRRHGVGTFVTLPHVDRDHSRLSNFFENSIDKGIQAEASILEVEVIPGTSAVTQALSLDDGDLIVHIKSLRYADQIPVTLHDAYIPYKLFPHIVKDGETTFDIQQLWTTYENSGYRVHSAVQKLEARQADAEIAALMNLDAGAPILYKERTVYSDDGTPVEYTYCYNRGDLYSLTVTLYR
jgi:GntR family transcriptional regulator